MKRYLLLPLIILLSVTQTQAQTQTRRIEIGGYGEMKIAPDQGVLNITLEARRMDFGATVEELSKKEKHILKLIASLGYDEETVRTSNFMVRDNIIWKKGTRYDSGFIAGQSMTFDFPNSKKNIADILNTFSSGKTDAEIRFSFKLSDELKEKMNAQVVELAVKDARENAELLAKYSGVKIKSVLKIEYHIAQNQIAPQYNRMEMSFDAASSMKSAGGSQGFNAEDITLSDRVTIYYEIE